MGQYDDEIQLKDILITLSEYKSYLLKRKFIVFSITVLFGLIGVVFSIISENEYEADLTFVVEGDSDSPLGGVTGLASQFGFNLGSGGSTFSQSNIVELLKSRRVVQSALITSRKINKKQALLIKHYLDVNQARKSWINKDMLSLNFQNRLTHTHDSIIGLVWLEIIENDLSIGLQSDDADIVKISYNCVDQKFGKFLVESLIYEMSKMYTEHQTAQASNSIEFITNRADSVFTELKIAEEEFARVTDINQRIVKASGRLRELQLMRQVEVLNTMYLEIIKNLELSKMTLLNETPIIKIIDKPVLPLKITGASAILITILAGLFGGFLATSFLIFRKLLKDSLKG